MIKAKYKELSEEIEQKILSGKWHRRLPGVNILSRELDVNARTILKALTILETKKLIYRDGTRGTFIREKPIERKRHNSILFITNPINRHAGRIDTRYCLTLDILEEVFNRKGIGIFTLSYNGNSNRELILPATGLQVDGVLLGEGFVKDSLISGLIHAGVPFLSIGSLSRTDCAYVDYDNDQGLRDTLEYLYSKYKKPAYLGYKYPSPRAERTLKTFKEISELHGKFNEEHFMTVSDLDGFVKRYGTGKAHFQAASQIAKKIIAMPERPDSFFVDSAYLGYELSHILNDKYNIKTPEDMAFVLSAGYEKEELIYPEFTTLCAYYRKKVRIAGEKLLELIDGNCETKQVLIPRYMVYGKTG